MVKKNKNERLGTKIDNRNIKNEPFFNSIDWYKLENGELNPPINPNLVFILFDSFIVCFSFN